MEQLRQPFIFFNFLIFFLILYVYCLVALCGYPLVNPLPRDGKQSDRLPKLWSLVRRWGFEVRRGGGGERNPDGLLFVSFWSYTGNGERKARKGSRQTCETEGWEEAAAVLVGGQRCRDTRVCSVALRYLVCCVREREHVGVSQKGKDFYVWVYIHPMNILSRYLLLWCSVVWCVCVFRGFYQRKTYVVTSTNHSFFGSGTDT